MKIMNINFETYAKRNSNIELLRLIIMFAIFVNHMISHGILLDNGYASPFISDKILVVFGVSLWVPAAMVFIIISGYFGIKPSWKGIIKYSLVCVFYCAFAFLLGGGKITIVNFAKACIFLSVKFTGLWFIVSYFYLYCMTPIINCWLVSLTDKKLETFLICFILMDLFLGYVMKSDLISMPIHFFLLYSIGYYIKVSERSWIKKTSVKKNICFYIVSTLILFIFAIIQVLIKGEAHNCFGYYNPLITIQAIFIMLIFCNIKIKKSIKVNYLAASAFPVYLISENVYMRHWFVEFIQCMKYHFTGVSFVICFCLFCVIAYLLLILLDKVIGNIYMPSINKILNSFKL